MGTLYNKVKLSLSLTSVDLERVRDVRGVVDAESDDEHEIGGRENVDLQVPPRYHPDDVDYGEDDTEDDHAAEAQVAQHQQRDDEHGRQRQADVASKLVACWRQIAHLVLCFWTNLSLTFVCSSNDY